MTLRDWLPNLPRRDRGRDVPDSGDMPEHKGERRVPRGVLLSQIHREVVGGESCSDPGRRPDKVTGLQWAARAQERAVEDGRFDDALRAGAVVGHLMADLRRERR